MLAKEGPKDDHKVIRLDIRINKLFLRIDEFFETARWFVEVRNKVDVATLDVDMKAFKQTSHQKLFLI